MNIFEIKSTEFALLNYLAGFCEIDELPEAMQQRILPEGAEEESLDGINELLAEIETAKSYKLDYLARLYKNELALAEALKAEKASIDKRRAHAANKAERLKDLLRMLLTDNDGNVAKYESAAVKITTRKSEEVELKKNFDPCTLPADLQRVKIEADRMAIKAAIKEGWEPVEGVELVNKVNLIIK